MSHITKIVRAENVSTIYKHSHYILVNDSSQKWLSLRQVITTSFSSMRTALVVQVHHNCEVFLGEKNERKVSKKADILQLTESGWSMAISDRSLNIPSRGRRLKMKMKIPQSEQNTKQIQI